MVLFALWRFAVKKERRVSAAPYRGLGAQPTTSTHRIYTSTLLAATVQNPLCVAGKLCKRTIKERHRVPTQAGRLGVGILKQTLFLRPLHCIAIARKIGALSWPVKGTP